MPHPHGIPTEEELRDLSVTDLVAHIDKTLAGPPGETRLLTAQMYRDERNRREQAAATNQMRNMTVVILILTAVNVWAVCYHP